MICVKKNNCIYFSFHTIQIILKEFIFQRKINTQNIIHMRINIIVEKNNL
jgi:hypothetical protein